MARKKRKINTTGWPKEGFSITEAAHYLGISRRQTYDLVQTGKLPSARISDKIGAIHIIPRSALDAILKTAKTNSTPRKPAETQGTELRLEATS